MVVCISVSSLRVYPIIIPVRLFTYSVVTLVCACTNVTRCLLDDEHDLASHPTSYVCLKFYACERGSKVPRLRCMHTKSHALGLALAHFVCAPTPHALDSAFNASSDHGVVPKKGVICIQDIYMHACINTYMRIRLHVSACTHIYTYIHPCM